MKKITLLFIAVLISVAAFSQNFTVSYVNGYKILKGERPEINIRDFPEDSYEQGKIKIKIDRSYEMQLPDVKYQANSKGFVQTGISALDNLNAKFQATSYEPLFGALYETNSKSNDFRERHRAWGFHLWFTIELPDDVSIADAVEAYQALPFVEVAEPFYNIVLHDADDKGKWTPNDQFLNNQWHYNNTGQGGGTPGCDISLFDAWEIETGNSDVIVSIMDCGINQNHPDLQANMWSGIGYNFYNGNANINPGEHGCHTGGTVSAVTNNGTGVAGVAGGTGSGDGVRLMTCQIFPPNGQGSNGAYNAFVYAADNGACISQNSWGYGTPNQCDQSILNGIDYFIANGGGNTMQDGIVFFSSGNNNNWPYNGLECNYYPGYYAPVVGVTATNNQDRKSSYAHYGTWVGICAPGGEGGSPTGVYSCNINSYTYMSGTSMACPHVSGVAALLVSYAARYGYKLSSNEVKDLLMNNVDEIYPLNPSYVGKMGTGRLNALKALVALTEMITTVKKPVNATASPLSYSEIELNWQKNENNNDVIVFANTVNQFGDPEQETEYQIGDLLPQGGEVIYFGDAENFIHSELSPASIYYYKFFSYTENFEYSQGIECDTATLCRILEPFFEDFEDGFDICLIQENITGDSPWVIGKGNGGSYPEQAYQGDYNIYLAFGSISDMNNETRLILPPVAMENYNNVKLSFALHNQSRDVLIDHLTLYYKTSESKAWNFWKIYNSHQDTWVLDTITLPENVDTEDLQICFEGKIRGGYGICLDNISVEAYYNNVGITDLNLDSKIKVFPNPTTGKLRIENGELRFEDIEIFDIYGRKQKAESRKQKENGLEIDISHLAAGIYFLKVANQTVKVIKE